MPSQDSKPFFAKTPDGDIVGLDATLAQNIASRLGVSLFIDRSAKSYDDAIQKVSEGKADIALCHLTTSLERALIVDFSTPYLKVPHVLLLNRQLMVHYGLGDKKDYSDELKKEKITLGATTGSYFARSAHFDFPNAIVQTFDGDEALFEAVEKGEVQVVLTDETTFRIWQEKHPSFNLQVQKLNRKNRVGQIAIATNWKSAPLLKWLNLYLNAIRDDGTLDKWIQDYVEGPWKRN